MKEVKWPLENLKLSARNYKREEYQVFLLLNYLGSRPPNPPPPSPFLRDYRYTTYVYEEVYRENHFLIIIYNSYLLWNVNSNCPTQALPFFILNNIKYCSFVHVIGLMEH
jgi:hypothetical protein